MSGGSDQLAGVSKGLSAEANALEGLQKDVLESLPHLLRKALQEYVRFSADVPCDGSKAFVAYQAGCRAALTHIHLLVKLALWARSADVDAMVDAENDDHLDHLIEQAEAALSREFTDDGGVA